MTARVGIGNNCILPLLDEICNWLCPEETEKIIANLPFLSNFFRCFSLTE